MPSLPTYLSTYLSINISHLPTCLPPQTSPSGSTGLDLGVEMWVINTDAQALSRSSCLVQNRVNIGGKVTLLTPSPHPLPFPFSHFRINIPPLLSRLLPSLLTFNLHYYHWVGLGWVGGADFSRAGGRRQSRCRGPGRGGEQRRHRQRRARR